MLHLYQYNLHLFTKYHLCYICNETLYFTFVITERTIGFIDFIEKIESFFSIEIFFTSSLPEREAR